jgi:acetyltransferase-like isoleucine patch superfamily enzyme
MPDTAGDGPRPTRDRSGDGSGNGSGDRRPAFASIGVYSEVEQPMLSVVNPQCISLGVAVHIGAYAVIEALVPERGVTVRLDDRVYIGHFLRLTAVGGVHIGADAMLSDRVYVSDTSHIYEDVTRPIKVQGLRDGRRVDIGEGAWVGIGAAICGDVRIGRNAVVGANAVVVRDVPDCTVVAGNPAIEVRRHDGDDWRWATDPVP